MGGGRLTTVAVPTPRVAACLSFKLSGIREVLGKSAVLVLDRVGTVDEAGHAVARGERLGHPGADGLDDAGKVAADAGADHVVGAPGDVLPVRRVQRHGRGAHQDIIIPELGQRHHVDRCGVLARDGNGFDLGRRRHDAGRSGGREEKLLGKGDERCRVAENCPADERLE